MVGNVWGAKMFLCLYSCLNSIEMTNRWLSKCKKAIKNDKWWRFCTHLSRSIIMEHVTGIEPAYSAWEANVLPLNYTCLLKNKNSVSRVINYLVGTDGIEPPTFCTSNRCSPSWAKYPFAGADYRNWTCNLLITIQLLYQIALSRQLSRLYMLDYLRYCCNKNF